ncbi:cytochrome P450 [Vitiosangium sp. GDMCC 1.1324]|uniref:cytochrome P450 n=1 Tax=Vitiosangium sp. (strain GDMCC 1.1324) TaxID=2138576 RepID=UPI000D356977|nr:cytochrome P450 [Vitiosangium sp. GDMCC 1.1324]PTL82406.1 cytochrome P450 [Vitiosangium sp. GDMCC 1.1324]
MLHPDNHHQARPTADFNPYAPGFDANPYPAFEKLRTQTPIGYWEQGRGWLISRYEDAVAILRDSKRFTSDRNEWELASVMGTAALVPELAELNKHSLLSLANQDHVRVRKLVSPALTPRAIERLRPEIQSIVDELLSVAEAKGTVNVITDIADLIPARVIGSMLKMPKGREALFQRFTEAAVKTFIPGLLQGPEVETLRADIREGVALVRETIEDRRRNPLENDILTTLIQTEEQGDRLNTAELLSLVSSLIVGGFETTIHLIGFTVYHLLSRPEVLAQVKAEPELVKNLIEEVLRYDNFGKMGIARYALEDVELSGVTIKKGQMALIMLGSSLRDEAAFDKAEVFDVRRNTNASIAFGHGAHYCIGANLARLEVQLAVGALLQRFPEMKLVKPVSFGPHPVIRRIESLEVRLRPE